VLSTEGRRGGKRGCSYSRRNGNSMYLGSSKKEGKGRQRALKKTKQNNGGRTTTVQATSTLGYSRGTPKKEKKQHRCMTQRNNTKTGTTTATKPPAGCLRLNDVKSRVTMLRNAARPLHQQKKGKKKKGGELRHSNTVPPTVSLSCENSSWLSFSFLCACVLIAFGTRRSGDAVRCKNPLYVRKNILTNFNGCGFSWGVMEE
jgi:hypothetical protein